MEKLTDLPNIGKVLASQLNAVGIETPQALLEAGSREAWLRILAIDPSACINRLYGLEGAVRRTGRYELPQEVKDDLKAFYTLHKK